MSICSEKVMNCSSDMNKSDGFGILTDRVFWIYFIITLFFIIIGLGLIIASSNPSVIAISVFWLISSLFLMILTYYAHLTYQSQWTMWIFVNILFIILIILATSWAGELGNSEAGPWRSISGILIILGGIILYILNNDIRNTTINAVSYWTAIGYLLIWFGLTLYVTIHS
jgi:hypothetical protein